MIQFLVTALIVVIGVFLLTLLLCLMVWVVTGLLRFLFPQRFGSTAPKPAKDKKLKKGEEAKLENRCPNCTSFFRCTLASGDVKYPCRFYVEAEEVNPS